MDRQAILGFVLIFIILMVWISLNAPPEPEPSEKDAAAKVDTIPVPPPVEPPKEEAVVEPEEDLSVGEFFEPRQTGTEQVLMLETDLFKAELSSKGGVIRKWTLKNYNSWDGIPVQLVDYDHMGDLSLLFGTKDGKLVNTRELYHEPNYRPWQKVVLTGDDEYKVTLTLPATNGGRIVKVFRFKNGVYGFDVEIRMENMGSVIANFEYQVVWESGLRYAELNSVDESNSAAAFVYAGNELTEIDASTVGEVETKDVSGSVSWVATRTKYFGLAIIPEEGESEGAYLEGSRRAMPNSGAKEDYGIAVKVPFRGDASETHTFSVFLGPLEYDVLTSYGKDLDRILSLGWAWLIRPISVYVMIPLFKVIHYVVPNWGLVLIIFAIIIKIALHPLSKTSMKSMKKMQALQPMMEEIREKYKEDPQKMNQQIMNLYKEYGVNPAGGCLPLLLQFPILIALYSVFRSAIELRQADFIWWIHDLSIPDKLVSLPFQLPIFGLSDISGLALLMGITTFVQQKMTVKDPRQKTMVYVMPAMLFLLFNSFPAGLNLYYFAFNLLSIGQQMLINRQHDQEPLRKVQQKKKSRGGIFGKYTKDLPRFKR